MQKSGGKLASPPLADRSYKHTPLNESRRQVRLLRLAPGNFHQPTRGPLIVVSLDKLRRHKWIHVRRWTALSYVWGSLDRNETIRISHRNVCITSSLRIALQHLRYLDKERYLWVDQICVNQDDFFERSSQVRLMRNIYTDATYVFGWLGVDNSCIEELFNMLRVENDALNTPIPKWRQRKKRGQIAQKARLPFLKLLQLESSDVTPEQVVSTLYRKIQPIFDNAWFKRIWTLQEAVLPSLLFLQAGRALVFWHDMMADFFGNLFVLGSLAMSVKRPGGQGTELPWTSTMCNMNREATDPRDYVYGTIGLFNSNAMDFLTPDYSTKVEDVFTAGTLALLGADKNLDALENCCYDSQRGHYCLPSWCRDWSDYRSGCGMRLDDPTSTIVPMYNAALAWDVLVHPATSNNGIYIRGVVVDETITTTSDRNRNLPRDIRQAWLMISDLFEASSQTSKQDGHDQALCRALVNNTFDKESRADLTGILHALVWLQDLADGTKDTAAFGEPLPRGGFVQERIVDLLQGIVEGTRSLFETTGHRFGRSCAHVQPGDKICLLYGGRLPFILRRAGTVDLSTTTDQPNPTQTYRLIGGECYVNGLVYGEGVEIKQRENLLEQDFYII